MVDQSQNLMHGKVPNAREPCIGPEGLYKKEFKSHTGPSRKTLFKRVKQEPHSGRPRIRPEEVIASVSNSV